VFIDACVCPCADDGRRRLEKPENTGVEEEGERKKNARGSRKARGGGRTPGESSRMESENTVAGEMFRNRLYPVHTNSQMKARRRGEGERERERERERKREREREGGAENERREDENDG